MDSRVDPAGGGRGGGVSAGDLLFGAGWARAEPLSCSRLAGEVAALPRLLLAERGLVWAGLVRELRLRFGTTALGWAWPLARPLLFVAACAVLFERILGARPGAAHEPAGAAYVVVGVLVWASISAGLSRAASSIVERGGPARCRAFPRELLPLRAVLVEGVALLPGAAAFLGLAAAFGACGMAGGWSWPAGALAGLPLVFAVQLVLVYGLALGLCALQRVLGDTRQALGAALTLASFATPVFWSPAAPPGIAWPVWIEANPFHHLLGAWRAVLIGEGTFPWASLGYALCCALAALIAGHALFRSVRARLSDEV